MPPHGPIKDNCFCNESFWRAVDPSFIYKSKLSFTLFDKFALHLNNYVQIIKMLVLVKKMLLPHFLRKKLPPSLLYCN
jgi:hypothetical protein